MGDQALISYTEQFDGVRLDNLIVTAEEFAEAQTLITEEFLAHYEKQSKTLLRFMKFKKNSLGLSIKKKELYLARK